MQTATLDQLTAATPATRNRAIDAYRAGAMVAVAAGHWLAAAIVRDGDSIAGANALDYSRSLHWLTYLFQVMPLFFCLGGYSNAASLDAHHRAGRANADWVAARLRRLTKPAGYLAGTWFAVVAVALMTGLAPSIALGASAAAAIPLWFLANYVADTALAPTTLRWHRTHGWRFSAALAGVFALIEVAHLTGVPVLPKLNIVVGWMLFQVLGFWWRDGLLPSAARLRSLAAGSAAVCGALVALGPWPLAMVRVPSQPLSNTWPPSAPLVFFGLAYCFIAIAAAPAVDGWLKGHRRAWSTVAAANTITMTVYLWHFTALAIVGGLWFALGLIGDAPVGSGSWWIAKIPMLVAATIVLAAIVALVGKKEREGLLSAGEGRSFTNGQAAALSLAIAAGFEVWTEAGTNPVLIVLGTTLLLASRYALGVTVSSKPRRSPLPQSN